MSYRPTSDAQTRDVAAVIRAYQTAGLPPLLAVFVSLGDLTTMAPWGNR